MFVQLKKDFVGHPAGERIDLEELIAKSLCANGTAEEIPGDPLGTLIAQSMESCLANLTKTLDQSLEAALKEFATTATKSRRNRDPALYGNKVPDKPEHSFGNFLMAVCEKNYKALDEMGAPAVENDGTLVKADMTTNIGARGGFMVPTQHYDDIALRVLDMSVVRKYARTIAMTGRTVEIPTPNYVTAPSAGDTATLSGMSLRWSEEGAALTQTEPTLKQLELTNYELSGYSKLNNSLLMDAPALESYLKDLFAEGISWYEDYAFLRGDGVKKPFGMITWVSNASFTQTRSAASAVALADVAKLYGKLLRGTAPDSSIFWVIHPTVIEKLLTMTGGDNVIFLGNDVNGRPQWQILGHPVQITEKVPALNTAGDILLANGAHYLIGDRKQYEVSFSEHAGFTTNQTYFRVVSRVGGLPWISTKITLADATSTLGSFVTLAAG